MQAMVPDQLDMWKSLSIKQSRIEEGGNILCGFTEFKNPSIARRYEKFCSNSLLRHPDRLFILSPNGTISKGTIVYRGGKGSRGFDVAEMKAALEKLLLAQKAQKIRRAGFTDAPKIICLSSLLTLPMHVARLTVWWVWLLWLALSERVQRERPLGCRKHSGSL